MNRDEQLTLLMKGTIEVQGRVVTSSNQALLVTVSLDGVEGQACYKAEAGERPLWDFPDGLWRREVAAYELCLLYTSKPATPDFSCSQYRVLPRRIPARQVLQVWVV